MPIYSAQPQDENKSCKARAPNLRTKFKNMRELTMAVRGMLLKKAQRYLHDVIAHKDIVPFRRYRYGIGRHAQLKKYKTPQGGWPEKSCRFLLDLLTNAQSNAETKGLDVDTLFISHIQCNKAPALRRRTYRAHGRINPYMAHPCHIELVLAQKEDVVKSAEGEKKRASKETKLQSGATATTAPAKI
eukprot:TRINITY_DN10151_c0_g1_i1.p1 TRINITY_DN10151_c0_g1~~TRINITY_DN10151_c0_g1_i1.p1  ORF type:complete len:187 (-),score=32.16 TRINITY_DN10151_c0_g1_i1:71-631(-)